MEFSALNLNTPLLNALEDKGFTHATTIQEKAFSVVMAGRDVVGIAQTGTGKTYAYILPLLRNLKFSKQKHPRILILVPTRELVGQVVREVEELTTYMNVRVAGVYGGTSMNTQATMVREGVDILVATPGRLIDLALLGALRLKEIKKLVIDEVDEMLNLGFRPQLSRIMDLLPERRQNLLFSATITEEVEHIIGGFLVDPERIEAAPTGTPLKNIEQRIYSLPNFQTKLNLLEYLLESDETMSKVLVFAATKKIADQLMERLDQRFPEKVGVTHSNKSQNFRIRTAKAFQDGEYKVLIATDLIARGLDIVDVSHVINMDTPEVAENYIHRIGRTGRAEKVGTAITFVGPKEKTRLEAIQVLMGLQVPCMDLPKDLEVDPTEDVEEKPYMPEYTAKIRQPKQETTGPAFHEKNEKNKKVNEGGSYRRKVKAKYKKPKTRGDKTQSKKRRK
ncbi:MAG: DEAD/DEAH box helicase [Marinilabiliaceae bacterium]|nr:DEAD/DEAH box helicase [Marinilabiliaceae bacterium]